MSNIPMQVWVTWLFACWWLFVAVYDYIRPASKRYRNRLALYLALVAAGELAFLGYVQLHTLGPLVFVVMLGFGLSCLMWVLTSRRGVQVAPEKGHSSEKKDDVVWVLSYSIAGNHFVYEQLTRPDISFAHQVTFVRTALEKPLPQQQSEPDQIAHDRHLCAVILVIEPIGIETSHYCKWVNWCAEQVAKQGDFRLFVALYGVDAHKLQHLADVLPPSCQSVLDDTVQFSRDEDFKVSLAEFLEQLDDIRIAAQKKRIWNRAAVTMGRLAEIVQVASIIGILGVGMYCLMGGTQIFDNLARSLPLKELLSFIGGVVTIPLVLYFIVLLNRPNMLHIQFKKGRAAPFLLLLASLLLVISALVLWRKIQSQYSWFAVGIVAGYSIEMMRRNGYRAGLFFRSFGLDSVTPQGHLLPQSVLDAINAQPPFVLYAPFISEFSARVFISYTRTSEWSRAWAEKLYTALSDADITCFLDRFSIKDGSCWRKTLNQAMGESNVVLVLLDQWSLDRDWPAAELEAALKNTRLAGVPDIFVLTNPALSLENSTSRWPVFEALLRRKSSRNIPWIGRLVGEDSVKMLVSQLRTYRFSLTNLIVTERLERGRQIVDLPLKIIWFFIGPMCTIFGWIAIATVFLQVSRLANVQGYLASLNFLAPVIVFLLCGFWAGFVGRLALASAFEVKLPLHVIVSIFQGLMAAAYLILIGLWLSTMQPLITAWAIVLIDGGWFAANAFLFHSLHQKPGIRRNG